MPGGVDAFGWMLIAAVPALYGLFWWLDYRWQSQQRDVELAPTPPDDDDER